VWEYSASVDVLGRVIEVVSGMDLDRFIEERVTKPMGMTSTGFYVREADRDRVAQPQTDPAIGKRPPMFDATQKPKLFSGGGGLVSTASDYLQFCEMLLHGGKLGDARLLSQSTIDLMTSNALKQGSDIQPTCCGALETSGRHRRWDKVLDWVLRCAPKRGKSIARISWVILLAGSTGTTFFVDPKQQLIIIMMIQVPVPANHFYRRAVRYLAYQSVSASLE